jgi:hypothetical protein
MRARVTRSQGRARGGGSPGLHGATGGGRSGIPREQPSPSEGTLDGVGAAGPFSKNLFCRRKSDGAASGTCRVRSSPPKGTERKRSPEGPGPARGDARIPMAGRVVGHDLAGHQPVKKHMTEVGAPALVASVPAKLPKRKGAANPRCHAQAARRPRPGPERPDNVPLDKDSKRDIMGEWTECHIV